MKRYLTLLFCLFLYFNQLESQTTQNYHRAKIYYSSAVQLQQLNSLGLEIDHGMHKKDIFIESDFSDKELALAQKAGFATEIIIENVQDYYAKQNQFKQSNNKTFSGCQPDVYPTPSNFELGSMGGFFTYDEILEQLDLMATLYPNIITSKAPISNFSTEEGRSIFWLRMSDNPNLDEGEPEILYDAVHHAREPASVSTLIFYMWYLLENYETDSEIQSILNNTELYFIPVVNPDGYSYNATTHPNGGGMWRKNRRVNSGGAYGVDNNRNYSYEWGTTGVSFDPNSSVYPGSAPFSEVENQAVKWFCENHNFRIAMNNHSYSDLLLFPFGYQTNTPTPDHEFYQAISEEMVCKNKYTNQLAAELYPASGDSDDWMYVTTPEKPKIFSFTPEIGSQAQGGFWPPASDIISLCNETMYMNLTAAHLVSRYAKVIDHSPSFFSTINIEIPFTIQRLGIEDADFTISITPISANIISVGSDVLFQNMEILDQETGVISLQLDNSIQNGDSFDFELVINNGYYSSSQVISKVYGQQQIVFEQAEDMSGWENTNWDTTTMSFVSNPTSITDSPLSNYSNNDDSSIETLEIDLTNAVVAELTYNAKWEIESDWDYVQIEISSDNGATWIPQCGRYTHSGGNYQAVNEPLYDGFQTSWIEEKISLNSFIGEYIKIRFQLVTDQAATEDGFYFDDLKVRIIPENCLTAIPIPCDDSNPNTINDIIQEDCSCSGSFYLSLDLKTILQGPYDSESQLMNDNLRNLTSFPLTEPFTMLNENMILGGGETTTNEVLSITGNNAIVDWVLVELRDGENPATIIQTQAALVQRDGDIVSANDGMSNLIFQDHSASYNSVFIAIKHRNHFGIRTLNPASITNQPLEISIDFSNPFTPIYGGDYAMETITGIRVMISGDANRDGQINAVDKNSHWQVENGNPFEYMNTKADFNLDGVINPVDKNAHWQINNSKIEQLD